MASPFAQEWRASLEAFFAQTARTGNAQQRQDAMKLLLEAGYSEAAITDLYIRATMHADSLPDDFVPDLATIEAQREANRAHPTECTCPQCSQA